MTMAYYRYSAMDTRIAHRASCIVRIFNTYGPLMLNGFKEGLQVTMAYFKEHFAKNAA